VRIEVGFEINSDGIVNVTARDPDTGQKASTRITISSGLSEQELEAIMERNRRLAGLDAPAPSGEAAAKPSQAVPASSAGDDEDGLELLSEDLPEQLLAASDLFGGDELGTAGVVGEDSLEHPKTEGVLGENDLFGAAGGDLSALGGDSDDEAGR
jgi:hypothetical protein